MVSVPAVTHEKFHRLKWVVFPFFQYFSALYFLKEKLLQGNFQKSSFFSLMYSAGAQQSTVCLCFISEFLFFLIIWKPEQSRAFITWAILKVRRKVYLTNKSGVFPVDGAGFLIHLLHWPAFDLWRLALERWDYWKQATKKSGTQSRSEDTQLLLFVSQTHAVLSALKESSR